MTKLYALSLKQPWAALLAANRKTIEIRSWPTARRGRILIHAARVPDERPAAWAHIDAKLEALAAHRGGFLGIADLVSCIPYRSVEGFTADCEQHLNDPAWFMPPLMHGFRFTGAQVMPFQSYPGWMRFFPVEWDEATARALPPTA